MSSSLKSFMLKLDILTSIFRNIFAQDCRIELAGLTFFLTQIWQHFLEFDLYLFVLSFEFLMNVLWFFRIITGGGDRSWLAALVPCISSCTLSTSSAPSWPSLGRPPPSCTLVILLSWFLSSFYLLVRTPMIFITCWHFLRVNLPKSVPLDFRTWKKLLPHIFIIDTAVHPSNEITARMRKIFHFTAIPSISLLDNR